MTTTVLSYGGGQDSKAILCGLLFDPAFKARHVVGELIVVMSATGNEHEYTNIDVLKVRKLCESHGVEFIHVTPDMGYHSEGWTTLGTQYKKNGSVGSKAFMKTCTDNLKIKPIYNFLGAYLANKYNLPAPKLKKEFYAYKEQHGKLRVLIGIAKGEESRTLDQVAELDRIAAGGKNPKRPMWMLRNVDIQYPLIEEGMDRAACQKFIASFNQPVPMPSNCIMCPYMDERELMWLARRDPASLEQWQAFEDNKLAKYADKGDKNVGVWGKFDKKLNQPVRLQDVLRMAKEKYPNMTDQQLDEHKMSHGHCIQSKY